MRLPVTPQLATRNGSSNKDGRLTNTLKEARKEGEIAVIRPGLVTSATSTGNGNGLVCFNGELVSVYGAAIGVGITEAATVSESLKNIATDTLMSVCVFNGWFLCASATQLYKTTDFVTFTPLLSVGVYDLGNLATNGTIFAIGFYNNDTDDQGFLVGDTAFTIAEHSNAFNGYIEYLGGKFVAIASGTQTATSADAINWTTGGAAAVSLLAPKIAYGNSVYVKIGYTSPALDAYAISSTDGLTWSSQVVINNLSGHSNYNLALVFAGDRFVVAGNNWYATSTDGVTWSMGTYFPYDAFITDLAYNSATDSVLAISKYSMYAIPQTKYSSFDNGRNWVSFEETSYNGIEYMGCVDSGNGFITFGSTALSGASNNIEILDTVSSTPGITSLASINDSRTDFAQSTL